jgi:hypothetical protein
MTRLRAASALIMFTVFVQSSPRVSGAGSGLNSHPTDWDSLNESLMVAAQSLEADIDHLVNNSSVVLREVQQALLRPKTGNMSKQIQSSMNKIETQMLDWIDTHKEDRMWMGTTRHPLMHGEHMRDLLNTAKENQTQVGTARHLLKHNETGAATPEGRDTYFMPNKTADTKLYPTLRPALRRHIEESAYLPFTDMYAAAQPGYEGVDEPIYLPHTTPTPAASSPLFKLGPLTTPHPVNLKQDAPGFLHGHPVISLPLTSSHVHRMHKSLVGYPARG